MNEGESESEAEGEGERANAVSKRAYLVPTRRAPSRYSRQS